MNHTMKKRNIVPPLSMKFSLSRPNRAILGLYAPVSVISKIYPRISSMGITSIMTMPINIPLN